MNDMEQRPCRIRKTWKPFVNRCKEAVVFGSGTGLRALLDVMNFTEIPLWGILRCRAAIDN